ncbi:hypothetical protein CPSG_05422 [Coccidioides posadasii str. Silveira]|uniref:Uncharacterized protein n=2 Tax=Coccidioides posadasii TaxID=199306 RepID=E9D6B3_COCPS|nr:hypothetical protein CPSG_05422 [Coccidioides posadasii str. Silveira]KMM68477.1 hypothetical protein CPAG_04804 [Coccidioides posadasii RMSCC 3488]
MQPLTSLLKWTARSQTVCGDHEQSDRREYTGDGKSKHYRQHRGGISGLSLSTFGFNSSRTNTAVTLELHRTPTTPEALVPVKNLIFIVGLRNPLSKVLGVLRLARYQKQKRAPGREEDSFLVMIIIIF